MRITKAKETECKTCAGLGYTPETADRMRTRRDREHGVVEVETIRKGYGCLDCGGTGQKESK